MFFANYNEFLLTVEKLLTPGEHMLTIITVLYFCRLDCYMYISTKY